MYFDQYEDELDFGDIAKSLDNDSVREFPYNCIGYLLAHTGKQACRGTGFLIGPDLVLTVAHNVYNRVKKTLLNDIVFYPGVSGKITLLDAYKVINTKFLEQYKTCPGSDTINYDYALLKLDRKVQREQYIQLGLQYIHCQEEIGIFGYRDCDESIALQKGIWKANTHAADLPTIIHQITTIEGNSGSPLLVRRNGKVVAIGIHKGGKKDFNGARAITKDLLANLLTWEKEMASQIKFSLMTNSKQTTDRIRSYAWLEDVNIKIRSLFTQMQELTLSSPQKIIDKKPSIQLNIKKPTIHDKTHSLSTKSLKPPLKPTELIQPAQEKIIEIKENGVSDLATKLQAALKNLTAEGKKRVTSVILKDTVIASLCFRVVFIQSSRKYQLIKCTQIFMKSYSKDNAVQAFFYEGCINETKQGYFKHNLEYF